MISPKRRFADKSGRPGELVMVRGGQAITLFTPVHDGSGSIQSTGRVPPNSLGIILCSKSPEFPHLTYVLFSSPCSCGWVEDGFLRRL